jgi:hypothetical protein
MGKVFISPTHAWIIPKSGEKPIKIVFDPPEWQMEEQDSEKRVTFSRKLTEEELAEFKKYIGLKLEDNKIGAIDADNIELDPSRFLPTFLPTDFIEEE